MFTTDSSVNCISKACEEFKEFLPFCDVKLMYLSWDKDIATEFVNILLLQE